MATHQPNMDALNKIAKKRKAEAPTTNPEMTKKITSLYKRSAPTTSVRVNQWWCSCMYYLVLNLHAVQYNIQGVASQQLQTHKCVTLAVPYYNIANQLESAQTTTVRVSQAIPIVVSFSWQVQQVRSSSDIHLMNTRNRNCDESAQTTTV